MSDTGQANKPRTVIEKDVKTGMIIENISPAILDSERLQIKQEAEQILYDVFIKYSE